MQKSFEETHTVSSTTAFDESFWNRFVNDVGLRLRALDSIRISWEVVYQQGLSVALSRINEVLLPAGERIRDLTELGFLVAASTTPVTLADGVTLDFELTAGTQAELFTPSEFLAVTRTGEVDDYAVARLVSYDQLTRMLRVQVVTAFGDPGPFTDWEISAVAASTLAGVAAMTDAIIARDLARAWAEKANGADVAGAGTRSAKHWATAASGSAGVASDRAAAADVSAASASASATSASAALTSFTTVYRGALSTDPVGGQNGHFYYYLNPTDSTQNIVKVYSVATGTWVPAVSAALGGVKRQDYSAALGNLAAGQTVFTVPGGFTSMDVFVNGVQMVQGDSFTVASPSFTLAAAVSAGDVVQARGYAANDVSDFYTKAQAEAAFAAKTHGHAISEVAGLQNALNGKAASAHSHAISGVTGLQAALDAKAAAASLGELAALNRSALFYSGSAAGNTNFEVLTQLLVNDQTQPSRNQSVIVRLSDSVDGYTTANNGLPVLAGTWRSRGRISGGPLSVQRVA